MSCPFCGPGMSSCITRGERRRKHGTRCGLCPKVRIGMTQHMKAKHERSNTELNVYIASCLQTDETFTSQCNDAVDQLVRELHHSLGPMKVVKGGSLGKGTVVKDKCDIDLVVFLNGIEESSNGIDFGTKRLESAVRASGGLTLTPYGIQFNLQPRGSSKTFPVDLLPAICDPGNDYKALYRKMKGKSEAERRNYSTSLVALQVDFVKKQPPNVKGLIRLVKDWRDEYKTTSSGYQVPSSYMLELITIHVWETHGKPARFDTKNMMGNVLKTLSRPADIHVYWKDNYAFSDYSTYPRRIDGCPFIVDPANPFKNVADQCNKDGWDGFARAARRDISIYK